MQIQSKLDMEIPELVNICLVEMTDNNVSTIPGTNLVHCSIEIYVWYLFFYNHKFFTACEPV